ncbi:MAG: carboxypeptidase M32 [Proteobacteria bacterium]|nr:carboxypeptidase M32 [Pseudomonadota bacterium]
MSAYSDLAAHFGRIAAIQNAVGILQWDSEVVMPKGGAQTRAESMAVIRVVRHDMLCDPRVGEWLEKAEGDNTLGEWERANLREIRRIWTSETALPADLVAATSRAVSASELHWREARANNDYAALVPYLAEVLARKREVAAIKSARLGVPLYDALLNDYEPGGQSSRIDAIFDDYAAFLPGFLAEVMAHQAKRPKRPRPQGPFPIEQQRALALELMGVLGYDIDRGRLDISTHPFCGGAANDVRITTRYDLNDFTRALMGVLHETGHALYEQGRPQAYLNQPVGKARGMSIHESQSLLIEMQVCRSRDFIAFAAPLMREAFGGQGAPWEVDALVDLYSEVKPSLIRVDADEVTYPAHVIMRYRLEKAMIAGDLALKDLPGAWNDALKGLIGIAPPDDRLGCLQDIHWPAGLWGYFSTYSLGAMSAAQIFDAAVKADPTIQPGIARGDFAPLMRWLRANIHSQGSLHTVDELMTRATGRPLDASVFKAHLKRRYLEG